MISSAPVKDNDCRSAEPQHQVDLTMARLTLCAAIPADNNEYELWEEDAVCSGPTGGSSSTAIALARPLQALLMTRASYEAQVGPSKAANKLLTANDSGNLRQ